MTATDLSLASNSPLLGDERYEPGALHLMRASVLSTRCKNARMHHDGRWYMQFDVSYTTAAAGDTPAYPVTERVTITSNQLLQGSYLMVATLYTITVPGPAERALRREIRDFMVMNRTWLLELDPSAVIETHS